MLIHPLRNGTLSCQGQISCDKIELKRQHVFVTPVRKCSELEVWPWSAGYMGFGLPYCSLVSLSINGNYDWKSQSRKYRKDCNSYYGITLLYLPGNITHTKKWSCRNFSSQVSSLIRRHLTDFLGFHVLVMHGSEFHRRCIQLMSISKRRLN